jgi:asparagine synthase (glutamine-hydrolysing)
VCGICGVVGRELVDRDALVAMTRTLVHRGPDDEGIHIERLGDVAVGLGFRRLSIIDLASGNQPIANEDGSIKVVLNGEIYNFRELREELVAKGHTFRTGSDVETVVHLYEEDADNFVTRLNGMFALALWDSTREQLTLARDRFGKKPLYYAEVGEKLLFGSELKALQRHPECPSEIDFGSLCRYLALEYVPAPRSIVEGVRKLPGAHMLRWRSGRTTISRYWDLTFSQPARTRSVDDYARELREQLRAAVRRRLVSDVPLGAFLSGGIDSSSVVAMMAEALPAGALKTFSIGFHEASFDESAHARRVARHFGTDHHEEVFTPGVLVDVIPAMVDILDEPFGDASVLPTYVLSRFTREYVTVALGGDGADELLAGYPTFSAEKVARAYRVPRLLHENGVIPIVDRLPVSTDNFSVDFKLKRFVHGAARRQEIRHPVWLGSFDEANQQAVLNRLPEDPYDEVRRAYASSRATARNWLERSIYQYAATYLQDDILVKVDRASMACSLEVRAPFLDVELAEFLGEVPASLKLHRLDTKHLLKRAMSQLLPPEIAERPKKGFGIPVAAWFKNELREPLLDELSPARLRAQGIFEPVEVGRLIDDHLSGRRDNRKQLWTLFVFQLWHRRWSRDHSTDSVDAPVPPPLSGRTAGMVE